MSKKLLSILLNTLLGTLLLALSHPSCAETLPFTPYRASYQVSLKGIPVGESVQQLIYLQNGQYRLVVNTHPYLNIVPYKYLTQTDFSFEANEIVPQHHVYQHQEIKHHKRGNVHFNWQTKKLTNNDCHPVWKADLVEGMQDKLSHSLQLRLDLLQGKREALYYTVAEETKILPYHFTIIGTERLKTNIGILNTLKVKHIDRKQQVTINWLAQDYQYLPVKMEHYRHGKKLGHGEILSYN